MRLGLLKLGLWVGEKRADPSVLAPMPVLSCAKNQDCARIDRGSADGGKSLGRCTNLRDGIDAAWRSTLTERRLTGRSPHYPLLCAAQQEWAARGRAIGANTHERIRPPSRWQDVASPRKNESRLAPARLNLVGVRGFGHRAGERGTRSSPRLDPGRRFACAAIRILTQRPQGTLLHPEKTKAGLRRLV